MPSAGRRRQSPATPLSHSRSPTLIQQRIMRASRTARPPSESFPCARKSATTWLKVSSPFSEDGRLAWNWLNQEKYVPPSVVQQQSGYDFTWPMSSHPAALYSNLSSEEHLHDNSAGLYRPVLQQKGDFLEENMHRLLGPQHVNGPGMQVACSTRHAPQATEAEEFDFNTALPTYGLPLSTERPTEPAYHAEPLSFSNAPGATAMDFDSFWRSENGVNIDLTKTIESQSNDAIDLNTTSVQCTMGTNGQVTATLASEPGVYNANMDMEMMRGTLPQEYQNKVRDTSGSTTKSVTICTPESTSGGSSADLGLNNTQVISQLDDTIGPSNASDPYFDPELLFQSCDIQKELDTFLKHNETLSDGHAGHNVTLSTVCAHMVEQDPCQEEVKNATFQAQTKEDHVQGQVQPHVLEVPALTQVPPLPTANDATVSKPVSHTEIDWDAYSAYDPSNPFGTDWDRDLGAEPYLFATDELGFPIDPQND